MPPQQSMPIPSGRLEPVPPPTISANAPPLYLKECLGIVTNLINDNYGVAAVTLPGPAELGVSGPYLVLFDTCEFWAGANVVSDADIPLSEVTQVGDMVKINAVKVDKANARNLEYLATAVMTSGDLDELVQKKFHESVAVIKDVTSVSEDKLTNFQVVVDFLNNQTIGPEEKEAVKKCTKLAEQIFAKLQNPKNPLTSTSGNVSSLAMPAIPSFPSPFLPVPNMGVPPLMMPQIPPPMFPPMMPHMPPMMTPFPSQSQGVPPWIPPRIPVSSATLVPLAPARVRATMLPDKISYWNDNLISNIDINGDYIDCVYCRETVAIKPDDKFASYYLNHYASESHNIMVKAEIVDQTVIRNYLSNRVMMNMQIRKEEGVGKAVMVHKLNAVLAFYECKHWPCANMVVSAWHFQNLKDSASHNQSGPAPPNWNQYQNQNHKNLVPLTGPQSSRWGGRNSEVDDLVKKIDKEEQIKQAQISAKSCKDTRIRLCQGGYLVKKLNDVIFDCVVCLTTIFPSQNCSAKFDNHAKSANHKDREKQTEKLNNQEKIDMYTDKLCMAKSRATMAIVQKTAKITCKFAEDYTYECFPCNQRNVSVFHFVDDCSGKNTQWSGFTSCLGNQSGKDLSVERTKTKNRSRESSPIRRGDRSRSRSASPSRGRRDWEYKRSGSKRNISPDRKRSSPKRARNSPSRSRWASRVDEKSKKSPAALEGNVTIKQEKN